MEKSPLEIHKLELKELEKEAKTKSPFIKINCPSCQNEIPADNLQLQDKIGKCNSCNAVFPFHDKLVNLYPKKEKQQVEISKPEGVDIIRFQDELDFTIDQPFPVLDGIGLFSFGFFSFLFTVVFFKGKVGMWLPILMAIGTFWTLYNVLTRSKNKIYLSIDKYNLKIKWRPKKMMKDKSFDVHEIDQLYLKTDGYNYSIHAIINGINGQKHTPLFQTLGPSLAKARYIKQEIEKQLEIEVRTVPESNVKI